MADHHRQANNTRAVGWLLCFGVATVIGYLIYEVTLSGVSPQLLTVNTFFWLLVYLGRYQADRDLMFTWRPMIGRYVLFYALAQFAYWYAFWLGLSSGGAPLALAIISLTMIVTPLMTSSVSPPEHRPPVARLIVVGFILLVSVFLTKLDLPLSLLIEPQHWLRENAENSIYAVVCMAVAVIAEGISDRCVYALAADVDKNHEAYSDEYRQLTTSLRIPRSVKFVAVSELTLKAVPIALILSILMLILHGAWSVPQSWLAVQQWLWLFPWLFILGMIGSSAKILFVVPLQGKGLDSETIPPLMAGRQIFFFLLAWGLVWALPHLLGPTCTTSRCILSDRFELNLQILPSGNFSYWAGVFLAVAVWLISWANAWQRGFLKSH